MTNRGDDLKEDIAEIKEKLAAIESLLQRLPEIQAAVFFKCWMSMKPPNFRAEEPGNYGRFLILRSAECGYQEVNG